MCKNLLNKAWWLWDMQISLIMLHANRSAHLSSHAESCIAADGADAVRMMGSLHSAFYQKNVCFLQHVENTKWRCTRFIKIRTICLNQKRLNPLLWKSVKCLQDTYTLAHIVRNHCASNTSSCQENGNFAKLASACISSASNTRPPAHCKLLLVKHPWSLREAARSLREASWSLVKPRDASVKPPWSFREVSVKPFYQ